MDVQTWPIDRVAVSSRLRRNVGDLASLKASMHDRGLINPLTVTVDGELIAGERRLRAAEALGWTEIDVRIWRPAEGLELLDVEAEENLCRLPLTPGEAEAYWQRRKELIAPEAEKVMRAGKTLHENSVGSRQERTTDAKAAKGTGYSKDTLKKVQEVREAAEDDSLPLEVQEEAQAQHKELMADPKANVSKAQRAVEAARRRAEKAAQQSADLKVSGQWIKPPPTPKPEVTLTQRLIASIGTVKGLGKLAAEIQAADDLDLDDHTIKVLRTSLRDQNKENTALSGALKGVLDRRVTR